MPWRVAWALRMFDCTVFNPPIIGVSEDRAVHD